jgi:hypothetical protein
MDNEDGQWRYPVRTFLQKCDTEEALADHAELLTLVVPGLCVQHTELRAGRREREGYIWFTWSREGMWERIRECFEEFGVADERLAYLECSGTLQGSQRRLPGVVEPEPRIKCSGFVTAAWTRYGLQEMDSGFCQRIMQPDRGGPRVVPYASQRCVSGNEWWLVGTRGDSEEVMAQEIEGSPLDAGTKENLLFNLANCRRE